MRFWIAWGFVLLGVAALAALAWFALPLLALNGLRPFEPAWVRALLALLPALVALLWFVVAFLSRRRRMAALEAELSPAAAVETDEAALAERMADALAVLKKASKRRGGYLYEVPWYVVIGAPGAGKTTALVKSGLKFPLARGGEAKALAGFGGTRHCDFWFTDEAVLVDTAGRYTTQAVNEASDRASWQAFLSLLARTRPRQPVNGVIVAISLEDLMTKPDEALKADADRLRARLAEVKAAARTDVPVYVMFTKADLVAGFVEYFGAFPEARRRLVWGATFRPAEKNENMVGEAGAEFDALVARLNEELPDRLEAEPDPRSRIFAYGFPSQMAALKGAVVTMLERIFEPTRFETDTVLRGFYFTSGTQEGSPIDQVIGSLARRFQAEKAAAYAGLGQAKSYFLHDLLAKVVFPEAGWVSVNPRAARRAMVARGAALAAVVLVSAALAALWWRSYSLNDTLIEATALDLAAYASDGRGTVDEATVADTDLSRVRPLLDRLRLLPAGYEVRDLPAPLAERLGLWVREALNASSETLYRIGLERLLRSRLVLRLERQLEANIADPATVYDALKVYKMLGGLHRSDDALVIEWMRRDWASNAGPGLELPDERAAMLAHLSAMLALDGGHEPLVEANAALVRDAEATLLRMNIADRAYALLKSRAVAVPVEDWTAARAGPNGDLVFEVAGGGDLSDVTVEAFFTRDGFHRLFLSELSGIERLMEDERWLLGAAADDAAVEDQFRTLRPDLLARYSADFIEAWRGALSRIRLVRLNADKPSYTALATLASATSPLKALIEQVADETALTRPPAEGADGGTDTAAIGRAVAEEALDGASGRAGSAAAFGAGLALKGQRRAGEAGAFVPGEAVEAHFARYAAFVEGGPGQRPVDQFLANLASVHEALLRATDTDNPNLAAVASDLRVELAKLKANATRLPAPFDALFAAVVGDFEGDATTASVDQLNMLLKRNVHDFCRKAIPNKYPFARNSNRDVPLSDFARLFAPGGIMDGFFNTHLSRYADTSGAEWTWRADSPIGASLSRESLRNFQRAAAIRDAFFEVGANPSVSFQVTPRSLSATALTAQLYVHGVVAQAAQGNALPTSVRWPGSMNVAGIALQPEIPGRNSRIERTGPWALFRLLDAARTSRSGSDTTAQFVLGGREATFRIRAEARVNPVRLPELSSFDCPRTL